MSAQKILAETNFNLEEMQGLLHSSSQPERAMIYQPIAQIIHEYTGNALQSLDSIFAHTSEDDNNVIDKKASEKIFEIIHHYRDEILRCNKNHLLQTNGNYIINKLCFDTADYTAQNFYTKVFANQTATDYMEIKRNIRNSILLAENELIKQCLLNSKYYRDLVFEKYSAIVAQSSTIVKPGENLVINAGIGAFSNNSSPHYTINGHNITPDESGIATYTIKSSIIPGNYTIPVRISFTRENGEISKMIKSISFTVKE
ncbi:MAG: hypothetical protein JST86_18715 [Bacteroidetes bacterium]|nr:hypothetical protein [Bacteroidota bacterium]